jgi:hypothetical protein
VYGGVLEFGSSSSSSISSFIPVPEKTEAGGCDCDFGEDNNEDEIEVRISGGTAEGSMAFSGATIAAGLSSGGCSS